ncbi:unnamed protein product [Zymoseptoria tritici ST99CH_1A5]|uniref:AMP-activated protein kinase glycogen-binding domain-containing protein n=1 Tax=Zymoseptoria tritici ST99CH_1A5 TaxID=1276529 RepID=A0A1Y6LEH5_ZYMTR|nr:unnamed protein product [Zymoseptoria tritici ST99CH_1A5]
MLRPRSTVADIKATFEARSRQILAEQQQLQAHSHRAGDLANMPPVKPSTLLQKLTPPSIDAILDTVPARLRPHWIGPKRVDRPVTPGIEAMKRTVTIDFSSPGLQPPVFIGTSLSDPQWEAIEMDHTKDEKGEHHFSKTFAAEEGEYQYKLRLGPGDWWICDDSKPKVDDGAGNQNNLVVVKAEAQPAPTQPAASPVAAASVSTPQEPAHDRPAEKSEAAPTMPDPHGSEKKEDPHTTEPAHHEDPPLLPHESASLDTHEQTHAPLFRHESMAIDDKKHGDDAHPTASPTGRMTPQAPASPIPEEADPNDPTLVKFPTDHKGIMEHLDRTKQNLPSDQSTHGQKPPAPHSAAASAPQSLSSVQEDEEESGLAELIVPVVMVVDADRIDGPMTPPMTPKDLDERSLAEDASKEKVERESADGGATATDDSSFSVLFAGLGFAAAMAVTTLVIRYFAPSSSIDSMLDS